ncbi:MAG: hypothetical protein HS100_18835 [Anaerolineales bacterium]|nr:hypothetical protein [Anaerolineales bacterium]
MRENGTLYYLLSDHLGSTSTVTFENGNLISQTKYKAWGEVRLQSGPSLTEYSYTGQYSYTADFGLMYYNARWYDPSLGRFAQADSIIPPGVHPHFMGAGGLDRYAYVNNSPVNFVDPSGHICVNNQGTDDEVAMAGDCGGYPNPNWNGQVTPSPSGWAGGGGEPEEGSGSNPVPVCSSSVCNPNGIGVPPAQQPNLFTQAIQDVYSAFNWSVQTPAGFTLVQTPGFPFFSGSRLYGDVEFTFQNNSSMTIGPTTISNGQFEMGSDNFIFQTGSSSIGALGSVLGVNIGNPLAPWGFDVNADYSVTNQNVAATYTLGIEIVARPDNTALAVAPVAIYVVSRVPAVIPLFGKIIQQGRPQCVPGFNC